MASSNSNSNNSGTNRSNNNNNGGGSGRLEDPIIADGSTGGGMEEPEPEEGIFGGLGWGNGRYTASMARAAEMHDSEASTQTHGAGISTRPARGDRGSGRGGSHGRAGLRGGRGGRGADMRYQPYSRLSRGGFAGTGSTVPYTPGSDSARTIVAPMTGTEFTVDMQGLVRETGTTGTNTTGQTMNQFVSPDDNSGPRQFPFLCTKESMDRAYAEAVVSSGGHKPRGFFVTGSRTPHQKGMVRGGYRRHRKDLTGPRAPGLLSEQEQKHDSMLRRRAQEAKKMSEKKDGQKDDSSTRAEDGSNPSVTSGSVAGDVGMVTQGHAAGAETIEDTVS